VCAFNPVYGQGMTTAALAAVALGDCLERQGRRCPDGRLTGLSARFQEQLARVNAVPWLLATSEDYRYRGTAGAPASWALRLRHRYLDRVAELTTTSEAVRRRVLRVYHLLDSPWTLLRPGVLGRALWQLTKRP